MRGSGWVAAETVPHPKGCGGRLTWRAIYCVPSRAWETCGEAVWIGPGLGWESVRVAELPTGTVTFLFTDLEGSTRLWEEHPEAMKAALARHDEILRGAVEGQGGQVVKVTGDGIHAVFGAAGGRRCGRGGGSAWVVQRGLG